MPLQDATAEKMLNNVADFIASTLAKPDPRAWDQLLIYCPRDALERRILALSLPQGETVMSRVTDTILGLHLLFWIGVAVIYLMAR